MGTLHIRISKLEKEVANFKRYPFRVIAVLVGLFTLMCAFTLSVTSSWSFAILWCSLVLGGFSFGLILWGICDFKWQEINE